MKSNEAIRRAILKAQVLTHYGNGKCECVKCGFQDMRALSIDHMDGKGSEHRRKLGKGGIQFYKWLHNNKFPEGFQTLCMNCQFIKRFDKKEVGYPSKQKTLSGKIRKWIDLWDSGRFHIKNIADGLALSKKESLNIRHTLFRMCKDGEILRVSPGCYKKLVKSISVSTYKAQRNYKPDNDYN